MKKIIRVTNEPSYNFGVKSYLVLYDKEKGQSAFSPKREHAKLFDDNSIDLYEALYDTRKYHNKATVDAIDA